ncbi:MAG: hypothetical protein IJ525_03560 [Alphaproteobacteria bacterium]|nr:hypothetical protein [Alphaproteobacteria bacterium]
MKIKEFLHKYAKKIAFTSLLGVSIFGGTTYVAQKISEDNKAKVEQKAKLPVKKVKKPVYELSYRNDTLQKVTSILLYYSRGIITRNFVENNNSYRMQMPYFAHEEWHHHNDSINYRSRYPLKPLEYYRLCMHDEVSANLVAILTARYEYLAAQNKKEIINRYKNSYMKFYFEAIEKGAINPESKDSVDIEKERAFLANGTLEMWEQKYKKTYTPRTYRSLLRFIGRMGFPHKDNHNYNYIRNYMYTIGGVNFADYLTKDIEAQNANVILADGISNVPSLKSGNKEITDIIINKCSLLKEVSSENQLEVFQNILIASKIQYMLRNKSADEIKQKPQLADMCYRQTMSLITKDVAFNRLVAEIAPLHLLHSVKVKDDNLAETMKKIYTFKDINLAEYIEGFDMHNVPVKKFDRSSYKNFDEYSFYANPLLDKELVMVGGKASTPNMVTVSANTPTAKKRISEIYHLKIPNFREPILTSASQKDTEEIFSVIREFEAIPRELKECNMVAQRKYMEKQDSLNNISANIAPQNADYGR